MKKRLAIFSCLALSMAMAPAAFADQAAEATAHVWVNVDPNVAMSAMTANVDAGSVQTGDFGATISYRVDANVEGILLGVCTTNLYKGDDPFNTDVAPIPVKQPAGALIDPENANPMNGDMPTAMYGAEPCVVDGFEGYRTEDLAFESSQNGHFSQGVDVSVWYTQEDPEKPMGEYSGKVVLYALMLPNGGNGGTTTP